VKCCLDGKRVLRSLTESGNCVLSDEGNRRVLQSPVIIYSMQYKTVSKSVKIRIYKTINLPVVLYGCESWPLTLRNID
jgi:hypothetical protein